MQVVHVVPTLVGGGAETLVRALVPRLAAAGPRVTVVSIYDSQLTDAERAALGVPLIEILRGSTLDAAAAFARTVGVLRRLRPDIVHGHVHTGKYFGRLAALAAGVPRIMYTEHHPTPEQGPVQRIGDRVLRDATAAVVAFHDQQRRAIASRDHIPLDRIVVIPNGIAHERPPSAAERAAAREALGLSSSAFVVLFAARMAAQKDPLLALNAFAELTERADRPATLLLAGDGPLAGTVRVAAECFGRRARVLGHVRAMRTLLAAADAYLMTSVAEAMPLGPIEAMSAGVPVVSTPWSGAHDLFRSCSAASVVVERHAAQPLARALAELRDADVARADLHAALERARADFDIGRTVSAHHHLYRRLCEARL